MSYPKVGLYRHCVNRVREKYDVTALGFDIVIFMSERDTVSKYDVWKYVSLSKGSVTQTLVLLEKKGFIKKVREHRRGVRGISSLYAISVRGRNMVMDFYLKLFPDVG